MNNPTFADILSFEEEVKHAHTSPSGEPWTHMGASVQGTPVDIDCFAIHRGRRRRHTMSFYLRTTGSDEWAYIERPVVIPRRMRKNARRRRTINVHGLLRLTL